jgi:hypothetical protein
MTAYAPATGPGYPTMNVRPPAQWCRTANNARSVPRAVLAQRLAQMHRLPRHARAHPEV